MWSKTASRDAIVLLAIVCAGCGGAGVQSDEPSSQPRPHEPIPGASPIPDVPVEPIPGVPGVGADQPGTDLHPVGPATPIPGVAPIPGVTPEPTIVPEPPTEPMEPPTEPSDTGEPVDPPIQQGVGIP